MTDSNMTDFNRFLEFIINEEGTIIETPLTLYHDRETNTTIVAFQSDDVDFRFTFNQFGNLIETGFYS